MSTTASLAHAHANALHKHIPLHNLNSKKKSSSETRPLAHPTHARALHNLSNPSNTWSFYNLSRRVSTKSQQWSHHVAAVSFTALTAAYARPTTSPNQIAIAVR